MLRLSKLADYGSQVMVYMARDESVHSASEVAQHLGIALPTVSKILKILARFELVESVRGAKGGYALARPAETINVAEIIDAMDGPISITECSVSIPTCAQADSCSTRSNWVGINKIIRDALEKVTLAQMISPAAQVVNFVERSTIKS